MKPIQHLQLRNKTGMAIHAELLLDIIASMNEPNVMRVIENALHMNVAKTVTLHNSLKWLKNKGYIMIEVFEGDRRSKLCKLTPKGKKYLGDN